MMSKGEKPVFPDKTSPELGAAIRTLRIKLGWSHAELATHLGTQPYRCEAWEENRWRMRKTELWMKLRDLWNDTMQNEAPDGDEDKIVGPLTIQQAIAGLSTGLKVPEADIEIVIRGRSAAG